MLLLVAIGVFAQLGHKAPITSQNELGRCQGGVAGSEGGFRNDSLFRSFNVSIVFVGYDEEVVNTSIIDSRAAKGL